MSERIAFGWADPRAVRPTHPGPDGPLAIAWWAYGQPYVEGNLLDYLIAFPEPLAIADFRKQLTTRR